ncbi:MAG: RNA methyltransferase [Lachnospiraceae bacterium]|nr:RNA methyltransferase [Lachnospiraceae bacterium]
MEETRIYDVNDEKLHIYSKLSEVELRRHYEPEPGIFICESPKVIRRALEAGYEPISVLTSITEPDCDAAFVFENTKGVPCYFGDEKVLKNLTGYNLTGGLLCAMRRKELTDVKTLLKGRTKVAVLEDVENPTNMGAIFRSAAAMGVETVVLTSDCVDPLYRRSARVSMGNVFLIPWTRINCKTGYTSLLKELGFAVVSMALSDASVSISDKRIKEEDKIAVILGNEGNGLKEETIKDSDYVSKIPMKEGVDSLNVAAASAVAFWEIFGKK